ncbi:MULTISPECIES: hypothetical protein [unclassified Methanoculleus]|jgi:hypothetical protein|uniref:Site-specific DNA-methyltransferase (adenine-specific) n=1 Tax=Methanoculleus palmolei TaxID=72612 RepID=A0ABD8A6Y5_9EURY|nr:hypothetical protein [Methanoculleus sp. UBA377]MDD2472956.1 hypothetical protein [Methanoculleus sp.]WOX54920.1 hypothetical protein R6Y95_05455 [Methanoculleus palmolei]
MKVSRFGTSNDGELRANSNHASNEYFLPVMGLIFLRHAYSRFLTMKDTVEANFPARGGKTRALTKEEFSRKSASFPETKICDVRGPVKPVDRAELEANDRLLTPGRYVGAAPEEEGGFRGSAPRDPRGTGRPQH